MRGKVEQKKQWENEGQNVGQLRKAKDRHKNSCLTCKMHTLTRKFYTLFLAQ